MTILFRGTSTTEAVKHACGESKEASVMAADVMTLQISADPTGVWFALHSTYSRDLSAAKEIIPSLTIGDSCRLICHILPVWDWIRSYL
ncbi:hypothetical protein A0H81_11990 [Grifola frondosa]|uniref:Uncharacterized protein n=1 Tax=Grifola frondosa TaxID=5627 RepID=A0A1C7LV01_GRIFR|nr:hypothetical protein A0H81_11990 [Grifola frondosa]